MTNDQYDILDPVNYQVAVLDTIPHKKQIEILQHPAKHKIICAGRRSGKSQMVAGELIRGAHFEIYPTQIVITPTYDQGMIIFEKIQEINARFKEKYKFSFITKSRTAPHPFIQIGKSIIKFGSVDKPDTLRGRAYDRGMCDEAAFFKKSTYQAIRPMFFDTGAPIWWVSSPWGKGMFKELWEKGLRGEGNYASFHFNYKDNPYITDEGRKEIELDIEAHGIDSVYVQAEILGRFVEDQDSYFKRELIEACVSDYSPRMFLHPDEEYIIGGDFARLGEDSSVFIVVGKNWKTQKFRIAWIEETKHKLLTDGIGRIKVLNDFWRPKMIYLDETGLGAGPTDILREQIGGKVTGITFTTQSKEDMYSNLKGWMEKGKLSIPVNKKLIFELQDLRYELKSSGHTSIHHPEEGGHDDYPTALALAMMHYKHAVKPNWIVR